MRLGTADIGAAPVNFFRAAKISATAQQRNAALLDQEMEDALARAAEEAAETEEIVPRYLNTQGLVAGLLSSQVALNYL